MRKWVLVFAGLYLAAVSVSGAQEKPRITLKVGDQEIGEILRSISGQTGWSVVLLDGLEGRRATLSIEEESLRSTMEALCGAIGCQWSVAQGGPALVVGPAEGQEICFSVDGREGHAVLSKEPVEVQTSASSVIRFWVCHRETQRSRREARGADQNP